MLKSQASWALICSLMLVDQPQLRDLTRKSYLDLLDASATVTFTAAESAALRNELEKEKRTEEKRLETEEKSLRQKLDQQRQRLKEINRQSGPDTVERTAERKKVHCEIVTLERDLLLKRTAREKGVPVAFENRLAKLELLERWPAERDAILQAIEAGLARQRKFGDVEDIGVRKIADEQQKDIKTGQDVIREMKSYGLMPPESDDQVLAEYVQRLATTVAVNSDLKVPLKATVLRSEEINAFMLPGGFLFINTGLLNKAETESELVGVIAHETAHAAARHGHRMMKRATIAGIVYQAVQVAAIIFTGGAVGLGTYYALQYGFYGLGMVLELSLLGVNREFETEADQLGAQYAWKAGYDPRGFITFFDKMASEEGYVKSASFFRTHPPFFDRILATFSEIEYLPKKADLRVDTSEFQEIKQHMARVAKGKGTFKKAPRLRPFPECEEEPPKPAVPTKGESL